MEKRGKKSLLPFPLTAVAAQRQRRRKEKGKNYNPYVQVAVVERKRMGIKCTGLHF